MNDFLYYNEEWNEDISKISIQDFIERYIRIQTKEGDKKIILRDSEKAFLKHYNDIKSKTNK